MKTQEDAQLPATLSPWKPQDSYPHTESHAGPPSRKLHRGGSHLGCQQDPTETALGVPERVTKDGEGSYRVLALRSTLLIWA